MKKLGKALGAVAIAGAVAAGGAAFTNSNTQPADSVAGYGTTTVSGVTATSISYTLNATGTTITKVNLVLTGDTRNNNIGFAFGADNLTVWENIVTSCYPCNDRKGSRTPEQAGMKLRKPPTLPFVTSPTWMPPLMM